MSDDAFNDESDRGLGLGSMGPAGVEIEDTRPADYASGYGQPGSGYGYEAQPAPERFAPAPPAEVRRGPRRIPDVQEFPAVGQRDYYAKASNHGRGSQASDSGKKPSLFERLTGRGKRASDSPDSPRQGDDGARGGPSTARSGSAGGAAGEDFAWRGGDQLPAQEKQELPVFFSKGRR